MRIAGSAGEGAPLTRSRQRPRLDLSLRERWARRIPRAFPGEGLLDVKERGEQDAKDRLSIFIGCQHTWRPARRFWTKVLRSCRRSGLPTGPGLSELSALSQVQ